jgi:UDP-3-O-[3-hydroxymyristoyl] glucosamine N-acyltransferase
MIKLDKTLTVQEIAEFLGEDYIGDGSMVINDVANLETAKEGNVIFAVNPKYLKQAEASEASLIIVSKEISESEKTIISTENPRLAFAKLIPLFYSPETIEPQIHATAVIGENCELGNDVALLANAVVGDNVTIGDNTVIFPNVTIENDVSIGADCVIHANVTIYDHTILGDRVIIHSGSVIGSDGFGYVLDKKTGNHFKIYQIGNVIIEDDVEIGSNVSIDRAALGSTVIKRDVKIDNLVQVGHNCIIGDHTTISGQSGLSGSVELGKYVTVAGQVGFADHLEVGDQAIIAAKAGVSKDLRGGKIYWGVPVMEINQAKKQTIIMRRLPKYVDQIKKMEKKIKFLQEKLESKDQQNE